jgi:hypothetical protein
MAQFYLGFSPNHSKMKSQKGAQASALVARHFSQTHWKCSYHA